MLKSNNRWRRSVAWWAISVFLLIAGFVAYTYDIYHGDQFYSAVFLRSAEADIRQISPLVKGKFYEANIHPDGTKAVYFGNTEGPPQIWLTDFADFSIRALTPASYASRHPSFSFDGEKIVFVADRDSGQAPDLVENMGIGGVPSKNTYTNLYMMNADGSAMQRLTYGDFQDQRPVFSPDGQTVAFVSNRSGAIRLWMLNLGSQQPEILLPERYAYRPNFSPDGKKLYFFVHTEQGRHQICGIYLKNRELFCFENDDRGYSHGPYASFTGNYLLMHSTRGGRWGIWKLPMDGTEPEEIELPGFRNALHASEAKNKAITFDILIKPEPVESLLRLKHRLID